MRHISLHRSTVIAIVVLISFFQMKTANIVHAQDTSAQDTSGQGVQLDQQVQGNSQVDVEAPLQLPDQAVTIRGSGEPGAKITVTLYSGTQIVYTNQTTVNAAGQWQVALPQFTQALPTRMAISSEIPYTITTVIETTTVTGAVVTSSIVLLELFVERIFRGLQILGLFRRRKTKGFVFDSASKKPVAFALLTISNSFEKNSGIKPLKETVVTTVDGFFQTVGLPFGKYQINVAHPDYSFPSILKKPAYATPFDFYQNEILEFGGQDKLEIFLIPLDPKDTTQRLNSHWFNIPVLLAVAGNLGQLLSIPMGVLSFIFLLIYPSFINFVVFSFYAIFFIYWLYKRLKTRLLKGSVLFKNGQPVSDAVVRAFHPISNELVSVTLTNKKGEFRFRLPKGQYRTIISKDGLISEEAKELMFHQIDLRRNQTLLENYMSPMETFDWNYIISGK